MSINFNINKLKIPVIWLDTSVIFSMAMLKQGRIPDQKRKAMLDDLYSCIYRASRKGKLICPLAEQDSEVWVERENWLKFFHTLTLGIYTRSEIDIKNSQLRTSMLAYVNNSSHIDLSTRDIFFSDPEEELREALSSPFLLTVDHPLVLGAAYHKALKENVVRSLEAMRVQNIKRGVRFRQQLEIEKKGDLVSYYMFILSALNGRFTDDEHQWNTIAGLLNMANVFQMWQSITSQKDSLHGFIEYQSSDYYKEMPYTKLKTYLWAHLLTDKQPIQNGDYKDIQHITTVMPYVDVFITDKRWSHFLKRNGFDKLYKTTVCYVGDKDTLNHFFSNL